MQNSWESSRTRCKNNFFSLTFLNCCCCTFTSIFTSRRTGYCISREKCSAKLSNWDKYDSHGCNLQALGTVINQRRPLGSGWELNFTSRRKIEIYYFCIRPVRLLWISLNLACFSLLHLPLHSILYFILLTCKKSVYLVFFSDSGKFTKNRNTRGSAARSNHLTAIVSN